MATLIMLIGLPGSGKSTIAAQLSQTWSGFPIIATDRIRAEQFGDAAIQGAWSVIWVEVQRQFRTAVHQTQGGMGKGAIYDATNAQRSQRRVVLQAAQDCGFSELIGLWINTPVALCLARNQARSRQVPIEIIQRMSRQLTGAPPSCAEGFSRVYRYAITAPTIEVQWLGNSLAQPPFGFPNLVRPLLQLS